MTLYIIFYMLLIVLSFLSIFSKKVLKSPKLIGWFYIFILILIEGLIGFIVINIVWKIQQYFIGENYFDVVMYIKFIIFNVLIFQAMRFLNIYVVYKKMRNIIVYALSIVVLINGLVNYLLYIVMLFIKSFLFRYGLMVKE